ncbi:hypothetical protein [Xanthomonas phage XacN1]|nr:hypothetical protein [Xanthomonas phage XacN1]
MAGYHLREIPRGTYGELSKIKEEIEEIEDSIAQGCKVMELVELSDLYGAIEGYLGKYHPTVTMEDLRVMSSITKRAFKSGARG